MNAIEAIVVYRVVPFGNAWSPYDLSGNSGGATPLVDVSDIRFATPLWTSAAKVCETSLITCRQNFFVCEAPSGARPSAVADVADA
ncbi:hypothetical protein EVAR_37998_1 [Eumeta japonica]|uniref:Uncharacterized protein n=1 Tax=Eumeta variegata TaxID=151549 RepID=A0A4C1WUL7_EUMVA|nr:hypothetical protein EVAR_37998_1 [Eumeta japonica]